PAQGSHRGRARRLFAVRRERRVESACREVRRNSLEMRAYWVSIGVVRGIVDFDADDARPRAHDEMMGGSILVESHGPAAALLQRGLLQLCRMLGVAPARPAILVC